MKLTTAEYEALYGAINPDPDVIARIHDDLYVSLIALINLYGGCWRPPFGSLSWDVEVAREWHKLARAYDVAQAEAVRARDAEDQQARAVGMGRMLIRTWNLADRVRKDARRLHHYYLAGFCEHLCRKLRPFTLMSVDFDNSDVVSRLLAICQETRRRFGDTLAKQGIEFSPPRVAAEFEYTTERPAKSA